MFCVYCKHKWLQIKITGIVFFKNIKKGQNKKEEQKREGKKKELIGHCEENIVKKQFNSWLAPPC